MRHVRIGLPARKVNFFHKPKGQKTKVVSFKIDVGVLKQTMPQLSPIQRNLLLDIHGLKKPMLEVINSVARNNGVTFDVAKKEYDAAFEKAREIALQKPNLLNSSSVSPKEGAKRRGRAPQFGINWENPESTPKGLSHFGKEFNKKFNPKLDRLLSKAEKKNSPNRSGSKKASSKTILRKMKNYAVARAYSEGVSVQEIANLFNLTHSQARVSAARAVRVNPKISEQRAQIVGRRGRGKTTSSTASQNPNSKGAFELENSAAERAGFESELMRLAERDSVLKSRNISPQLRERMNYYRLTNPAGRWTSAQLKAALKRVDAKLGKNQE